MGQVGSNSFGSGVFANANGLINIGGGGGNQHQNLQNLQNLQTLAGGNAYQSADAISLGALNGAQFVTVGDQNGQLGQIGMYASNVDLCGGGGGAGQGGYQQQAGADFSQYNQGIMIANAGGGQQTADFGQNSNFILTTAGNAQNFTSSPNAGICFASGGMAGLNGLSGMNGGMGGGGGGGLGGMMSSQQCGGMNGMSGIGGIAGLAGMNAMNGFNKQASFGQMNGG